MRRKSRKNSRKAGVAELVSGVLIGSVVGAAVGWLTAPAAGAETRRRLKGEVMNARERAKTVDRNIESRARELAAKANNKVENVRDTSTPQGI